MFRPHDHHQMEIKNELKQERQKLKAEYNLVNYVIYKSGNGNTVSRSVGFLFFIYFLMFYNRPVR
jgi:hypothetical protein